MTKRYTNLTCLIILVLFLSACQKELMNEDIQLLSLKNVNTIFIDYRSTNVNLNSTDMDDLRVTVRLYDNGPGITMDEKNGQIDIRVKSDITRLLKIGRKPRLDVEIPSNYTGDIVLKGSSGNIKAEDLQTNHLQIKGSSGNVDLTFSKFHSDIYAILTSGNMTVSLNEDEPDATVKLKSNSGRRSVDFLLDDSEQGKKETNGVLGNGEYDIQLNTSSGNIHLK